jgi:hypothetical protein
MDSRIAEFLLDVLDAETLQYRSGLVSAPLRHQPARAGACPAEEEGGGKRLDPEDPAFDVPRFRDRGCS